MGSAEEGFKKAHVKLKYEPAFAAQRPQDCKKVFVNVGPHVTATAGWPWKFEVDLLGSDISLLDAGGIVLALQVTTYVRWHMWFHDRDGKVVKEWHQVLVSLPMLYKLQGPSMLLMAVSPWPVKLIGYGGQVAVAFKKLKEVNKVLGLIRPSGQISWCLEDITALEKRLQKPKRLSTRPTSGCCVAQVTGISPQ